MANFLSVSPNQPNFSTRFAWSQLDISATLDSISATLDSISAVSEGYQLKGIDQPFGRGVESILIQSVLVN